MSAEPAVKMEEFSNQYLRVSISATASMDGKRITLVFPAEFIQANVAVAGDNNGRHRIIVSPVYGGQEIVGFVGGNGVKYGRVEINPAAIGLKNVIPNKTNKYWGKDRSTDILVGRLLSDLCDEPEPTVHKLPAREQQNRIEALRADVMTIESAVEFVNDWVQKNNGVLTVEDNAVAIEVRQRIGGKKNG